MNLSIEKNLRGTLAISDTAIRTLIYSALTSTTGKSVKNFILDIDFYRDNLIYVSVNLNLSVDEIKEQMTKEKVLIKAIEEIFVGIFKFKPRNIAISYTKKKDVFNLY